MNNAKTGPWIIIVAALLALAVAFCGYSLFREKDNSFPQNKNHPLYAVEEAITPTLEQGKETIGYNIVIDTDNNSLTLFLTPKGMRDASSYGSLSSRMNTVDDFLELGVALKLVAEDYGCEDSGIIVDIRADSSPGSSLLRIRDGYIMYNNLY